ncbi:MAG: hypothetical protein ACJAVX_003686 [Pseudoalteromonas rhizosphaerae]|jgi:hypothetical protein|uniref:hypothetical protein n=1 Tax=Pseudoalteromonas TaxID=53246 RepID=UPI0016006564|nr:MULTISPECIES: hypothetical protein [unclassified Pseudoalteromonas]MBB1293190.1 hypothetical protein [Pseudoalteromonas sp. SR41-4]MBB1308628.1 hypothetical protein [Pseudoalteromonas sp. SR41-8]MBB1397271.1 hypothetical protein [Pseudoalteromonas sp. SG44-8]MBB1506003.1 hypothetical protein [Pseudoalteromonas sp. SG41-1]|tara:strand:+ start:19983 stop:20654 length:672 start_codon:yes stop_codon:yes gene_type:complete
MSKNDPFSLLLAFITGVVLTWSYFALSSDEAAPVTTTQTQVLEQEVKIMPASTVAAELDTVSQSQQVTDITSSAQDTSAQTTDEQTLEQQVQQLKRELLQQQKLVKAYEQQLQAPSDFEQALLDKFTEQSRNEEWAYRTETAMKDFLQIADLGITPELVSAQCKSSVCKFELAAPKDVDDFDHTQWRELNDKLVQQDFWQQFKVSTSKSSDRDFSLLLSTESE